MPSPTYGGTLPQGSPYGAVGVSARDCTFCMACAGVCPTGALTGGEGQPCLRFVEARCVQCGLCAEVCPEQAITLAPRLCSISGVLNQPGSWLRKRPFVHPLRDALCLAKHDRMHDGQARGALDVSPAGGSPKAADVRRMPCPGPLPCFRGRSMIAATDRLESPATYDRARSDIYVSPIRIVDSTAFGKSPRRHSRP